MCPIPCSNNLAVLVNSVNVEHPGLFLDRYMSYNDDLFDEYDQGVQRPHISKTIAIMQAASVHDESILQQWLPLSLPVRIRWHQTTVWRMTMHLSRAASTENASVCLHPVYGFPYIPGTGLKGMTRAYAHIVEKKDENDADIQRIFGNLANGSGTVVFHDAWPDKWLKLEIDIVNSHHPDYYKNKGVGSPPGDWESPNPVLFTAIAPESTFRFALSPRSAHPRAAADTETAAEWLQKALQELGAGGKTAAGYGYFKEPAKISKQLSALQSGGKDALLDAYGNLNHLVQTWKETDGRYKHSKHADAMRDAVVKIYLARGGNLSTDDLQVINTAAGEDQGIRKFKRMIENIKNDIV